MCENFSVSIKQIDNCNSNGIIEVVYIAPFEVQIEYPNGTTATYLKSRYLEISDFMEVH